MDPSIQSDESRAQIPPAAPEAAARIDLPRRAEELRAVALGASGAAIGLALTIALLWAWNPTYRPYDGIVGPPAYMGFSPLKKLFGYALLIALGLAGLAAGWGIERRLRPGPWRWFVLGTIVALGVASLFGAAHLLPERVRAALSAARGDLDFWLQSAAALGLSLWLCMNPSRPPSPLAHGRFDEAAARLGAIAILALYAWLLFEREFGGPWLALGSALILAVAVAALSRRPRPEQSPRGAGPSARALFSTARALDVGPFLLLAPLALYVPAMRWVRSVAPERAEAAEGAISILALGLLAALCLFVLIRRSATLDRLCLLIPVAAAVLFSAAGTPSPQYDPYHQGEYLYAAKAMAEGLLPFRDIFFVHGFGYNLVAGWSLRGLIERAPALDLSLFSFITAGGVALMAWFYLRLFGRRWWLLALALAVLTAGAATIKGARFVPLFIVLLLVGRYLALGRGRWLFFAGAVAGHAVFYSLDVGAVAVTGGLLWAAAWGPIARRRSGVLTPRRWSPLAFYAAGVAASAAAALAWLASIGVLREFVTLHLEYAAIKSHYDNLPLPSRGLTYLLSPALTVIGIAAFARGFGRPWPGESAAPEVSSAGIFSQQRHRVLPGMILLLSVLNLLTFMRALDRSDEGHLVYATTMAWPLLGCLIVWRARGGSSLQCLLRSAALAAALAGLALASPLIAGENPIVLSARAILLGYREQSHRPGALPMDRMDQSFFDLCRELDEATSPGDLLYDMSNRPAIYYWSQVRCPSRFYAVFYPASLRWQGEVISRLEETETPWVLWPARSSGARAIDGIDLQLRQWALCAYLWKHYAPARVLGDGSILLARGEQGVLPQDWVAMGVDPVRLGAVAALWGMAERGAPERLGELVWDTDWIGSAEPRAVVSPARAAGLTEAREAEIALSAPWTGSLEIRMLDSSGEGLISFSLATEADFAGPYRVRLESFSGWSRSGSVRAVQFAGEGALSETTAIRMRFVK